MPRTSEAIVQALKEAGITTIFGIPSIHNIGLYDAIRRDGSFRHIVCRHEAAQPTWLMGMPERAAVLRLLSLQLDLARDLRSRRCKKPGAVAHQC